MWSSTSVTTPKPGGSPIHGSGKALWVLRCDADGNWKLAYDIWNSDYM